MNVCCCDWFNREADWLIAGQNKMMWESQTENAGKEKNGIWSPQQGRDNQTGMQYREKVPSHVAKYR